MGRWEPEAERLTRILPSLGDAELESAASWDMHLIMMQERAGSCGGDGRFG